MGFGPLVDAAWLAAHLREPDLLAVDIRWYLDGRSGRAAYDAGHIPGAVFLDLDEITGEGRGRHPLPSTERFQAAMRRIGVRDASRVLAYDDVSGSVAARLWWLLDLFGHRAAAVLDGGIRAWAGPRETATPPPAAGDFTAGAPDRSRYLDHGEVAGRGPEVILLDARAPERYRGETEPVDPRPGHIPGARSAFWKGSVGADGRLLRAPALRARFASLGVTEGSRVVAYCGSGVNACHDLLALEVAGLGRGRLYAGSWSDWSSRPDAAVATGDEQV